MTKCKSGAFFQILLSINIIIDYYDFSIIRLSTTTNFTGKKYCKFYSKILASILPTKSSKHGKQ